MPELPEVETVKLGLSKLLPGLVVQSVTYDRDKSFPNTKADIDKSLIKATIKDVRRRAKVLIIDLSTEHSLVTHLKMSGQMVFRGKNSFSGGHPTKSAIGELPDKHTRVILQFTNGSKLFFNDQMKFGWMKLVPSGQITSIDFMRKLGPEPLEQDFMPDDFINRLMTRSNSNIKATLLDQKVIAGVGNIYADESLFAAGIHPASIVKIIPKAKLKKLYEELRRILNLSIKNGGTTFKSYVNALGKKGNNAQDLKIYGRKKQGCFNCGGEIIKIRVAGRGTHLCPKCQKLYKMAKPVTLRRVSVRNRGPQAKRTKKYVEREPQVGKPKIGKKSAELGASPSSRPASVKGLE